MLIKDTSLQGDNVIYADYFIIGQMNPVFNVPDEIECVMTWVCYECAADEVTLIRHLHNISSREFKGLTKPLAYIMVKGDDNETFFLYGYDNNKSKIIYSAGKKRLPNVFTGTVFKKYTTEILNKHRNEIFSKIFFFLFAFYNW